MAAYRFNLGCGQQGEEFNRLRIRQDWRSARRFRRRSPITVMARISSGVASVTSPLRIVTSPSVSGAPTEPGDRHSCGETRTHPCVGGPGRAAHASVYSPKLADWTMASSSAAASAGAPSS